MPHNTHFLDFSSLICHHSFHVWKKHQKTTITWHFWGTGHNRRATERSSTIFMYRKRGDGPMNRSHRASPSACQFGSWQNFQQHFLHIWGPSLRTWESGGVKSTFLRGGGGRGTPHHCSTHSTGRGQPGKVRQDCKRNVAGSANIFHISEQKVCSEWKIRNVTCLRGFFSKKNPNSPVSLLCLPRGSSNSSPWPSLLSFALYNLLTSKISMVTTACHW